MNRKSDYSLHLPGGSELPGKEEAHEFDFVSPDDIRKQLKTEKDPEKIKELIRSLKMWEREFNDLGYMWRKRASYKIIKSFRKLSELVNPAINLPYYQDTETPSGEKEILDSLMGLYDNDNNVRFDYNRQGIRPIKDQEAFIGDFLSPSEPPLGGVVSPKGDGPDPWGMDCINPPTGGELGAY